MALQIAADKKLSMFGMPIDCFYKYFYLEWYHHLKYGTFVIYSLVDDNLWRPEPKNLTGTTRPISLYPDLITE